MSETLKQKMLNRMSQLGIEPKRSLGQNFLISDNVVDKIIRAADPSQFGKVFEIGPGLGALTDHLRQQSSQFLVVELDQKFSQHWRDQGLDVIEEDALKLDWSEQRLGEGDALLVSNLPYQISSRLVVELSLFEPRFKRMVLMFQKEVAQRIVAVPSSSDYGLLTVIAQVFWDPYFLLEAGAVDFLPQPKVASRVLVFNEKDSVIKPIEREKFVNFVKICFAQRRKKLLPKLTGFKSKEELNGVFKEMDLSLDIRAEKLSPEQFINLYSCLK